MVICNMDLEIFVALPQGTGCAAAICDLFLQQRNHLLDAFWIVGCPIVVLVRIVRETDSGDESAPRPSDANATTSCLVFPVDWESA